MKTIPRFVMGIMLIMSYLMTDCDCAYLNEYRITNKASGCLRVEINSICDSNEIRYIKKDSTSLICSDYTGATACGGPYKGYLPRHIYELTVYLNDSILSKRDYLNVNYWSFYNINETGQFELTITDNDFKDRTRN